SARALNAPVARVALASRCCASHRARRGTMANELQDLTPGMRIDGFTLGARAQEGGMGILFRVTKPGIEQALVMKLPRVGPFEPAEGIIAFETEAMIVPSLKGPHVPAFVAAGDLAGTPYLVTEWIEGRTLEELLTEAPLAPTDVARIGA